MDRVPDSAAVNTSVELAKETVGPWTGGVVNAILRRAIREADQMVYPDPHKDPVGWMSAWHSLPHWLAQRWYDAYGANRAFQLAEKSGQRAPLTLRTNTLKCSRSQLMAALGEEEFGVSAGKFASDGIAVEKSPRPVMETRSFENGWFQVQDEAAQLVTELLAPRPDETVLDACAGLGGKSGHIAQVMGNRGTLLVMDRGPEKLVRLKEEMERLGVKIITRREQDIFCAIDPGLHEQFDGVLLDAPCSGLGVIRRNPDVKWRVTTEAIAAQGRRQFGLLKKVAPWVKPGGRLVYSVCSTEPEETDAVVGQFLISCPEYTVEPAAVFLPRAARKLVTAKGFLRTDMTTGELDGFFAARFIRK